VHHLLARLTIVDEITVFMLKNIECLQMSSSQKFYRFSIKLWLVLRETGPQYITRPVSSL
ncbi:MAG: hypothetical protein ACKO96_09635, partial [Flammeovirgaceae bacterium]